MANWEDSLSEPPQEDETPIYDALYLEYREKLMERLGFKPENKTQEEK